MSEVKVGDEVAVASMDGNRAGFSPVVFVPHGSNMKKEIFFHITTETGRNIKMTADHLIMGGPCNNNKDLPLIQADSIDVNDCVQTIAGPERIVSVSTVTSRGVYTVITKYDGLLVVNGIFASPFAGNHVIASSFYSIIRILHTVVPSAVGTDLFNQVVNVLGDIITSGAVL